VSEGSSACLPEDGVVLGHLGREILLTGSWQPLQGFPLFLVGKGEPPLLPFLFVLSSAGMMVFYLEVILLLPTFPCPAQLFPALA
jgi:hypothetical protein